MLDAMPDDRLPTISFASRGFVRKDGTVFGWSLFSGDHNDYHAAHGTADDDFTTRWRQWGEGKPIDIEERGLGDAPRSAVEDWIAAHADDIIPLPRPAHG